MEVHVYKGKMGGGGGGGNDEEQEGGRRGEIVQGQL